MYCRIKSRFEKSYGKLGDKLPYIIRKVTFVRQMTENLPYKIQKSKSIRQQDKITAV